MRLVATMKASHSAPSFPVNETGRSVGLVKSKFDLSQSPTRVLYFTCYPCIIEISDEEDVTGNRVIWHKQEVL